MCAAESKVEHPPVQMRSLGPDRRTNVDALLQDVRLDLLADRTHARRAAWVAPVGAETRLAIAMRAAGRERELAQIHAATLERPDADLSMDEYYRMGFDEPWIPSIEDRATFVEACLRILRLDCVEDLGPSRSEPPPAPRVARSRGLTARHRRDDVERRVGA